MSSAVSRPNRHDLKKLLKCDHTLNGGILFGVDGYVIEIQARATKALNSPIGWSSSARISGMATGAVREVLRRIEGAFAKYEIPEPQVDILVNLAPADLPKSGTWLDLPLAIILLQAAGMLPDLPEHKEGDFVLMGELGIHGEVRRVPGALSLAYQAKPGQKLIVPYGNEKECALILAKPGHEGCGVFPVATLEEVIKFFRGERSLDDARRQGSIQFENATDPAVDLGRIRGQDAAKRGLMIAAAGGHNLLMIGPPGEGKSLLASAMPGILPRLTEHEMVELTKIYSACGKLEKDGLAVMRRPMRSVHHTASKQSVIGGGSGVPMPGEITLAHLGVLFLDEIAEFNRGTIEALRQPIEAGEVHLTRVHASMTYPSQFTLVAAMNPCPCGYYPHDECSCTDTQVQKYLKKLSGPIIDRIDLQVELQRLSLDERFAPTEEGVSKRARAVVTRARERQEDRYAGKGIPFNAAMPGGHVQDYCDFSPAGFERFKDVVSTSNLSTRSTDRLAKVARTIADLAASDTIEVDHLDEAKSFVVGGLLREAFS
ncbi:YifB family Mg chelatase-like AAA ATPase [Maioricimonas sp. JC845]|uniref:YifB family Mg chelatase-like AAA ATPase n=1 Tax=Maioricimonas sp. JC845 TaxID=3232138 RepID=UPI00345918AD